MKKLFSNARIPIVFLAVIVVAPAVHAQGWYELTPSNDPGTIHSYDMAVDATGSIIYFGGGHPSGGTKDETWMWDGDDWTRIGVATKPQAREAHTMCYDPVRQKIVLFSGWNGSGYVNDTFEWDGIDWQNVTPAVLPPGRDYSDMTYDPNTGTSVMFGGHDWWESVNGNGTYGDFWSWDGTGWTQLTPASLPQSRYGHSMIYDPNRGTVIMMGGINETPGYPSVPCYDMWEWDGVNWTQLSPPQLPVPRILFAMVWDEDSNRVVLHGGKNPDLDTLYTDTWEWDGFTWTQIWTTGPEYGWIAGAYDTKRNEVLIQGGATSPDKSTADDKTWVFTRNPILPAVDIKANGQDGPVMIPSTQNVQIDINIVAWDAAGQTLDVLVVIQMGSGSYYHNNGSSWLPGTGGSFYTGPLADVSNMRVLDMMIPKGSYDAYLAIDRVPNAAPDQAFLLDWDVVEIQVY